MFNNRFASPTFNFFPKYPNLQIYTLIPISVSCDFTLEENDLKILNLKKLNLKKLNLKKLNLKKLNILHI